MSKLTNPESESSVTCGFYNSIGDRKYDAIQMSELFDGIINDGVFASIGTGFVVKADTGNIVNVGIGKAWFNHTWTKNDAILPVTCEESEVLLDRIDAIVIEVNSSIEVRDNFIKPIKGTPSSTPVTPTLSKNGDLYQYPLCYIYRKAGSTEIKQTDITNTVGSEETPFITGLMQTISLSELLGQWEDELDQFVKDETADFDSDYQQLKRNMEAAAAVLTEWTKGEQQTFLDWFESMRNQLSTDAAGNLQIQLDKMKLESILTNGFSGGTKVFSDDGTTITSTDNDGAVLVKMFTDEFTKCTSTLKDSNGSLVATLVKTFSTDGRTISSTITII